MIPLSLASCGMVHSLVQPNLREKKACSFSLYLLFPNTMFIKTPSVQPTSYTKRHLWKNWRSLTCSESNYVFPAPVDWAMIWHPRITDLDPLMGCPNMMLLLRFWISTSVEVVFGYRNTFPQWLVSGNIREHHCTHAEPITVITQTMCNKLCALKNLSSGFDQKTPRYVILKEKKSV